MTNHTEPTIGAKGTVHRYGVQMSDGYGNSGDFRATYIGRRASVWRGLSGEALPDVYALEDDNGDVFTVENLRTLRGIWTEDEPMEEAEAEAGEILAAYDAHVLSVATGDMRGGCAVERGQVAVHSDGSVCLRAVSTRDCPYSHDYRQGEPVRYRIVTRWNDRLILSASNSIHDIGDAIRAAGIDPGSVTSITGE